MKVRQRMILTNNEFNEEEEDIYSEEKYDTGRPIHSEEKRWENEMKCNLQPRADFLAQGKDPKVMSPVTVT